MSASAATPPAHAGKIDPHRIRHAHGHAAESEATGHGTGGPASKRIIVGYGFWLFLLSDIVMFSALFAAYAVLRGATNGGPGGAALFDITNTAIETGFLLVSSFLCGLAMIAAATENFLWTELGLVGTGLTGAAFLFLEIREFAGLVAHGHGPQSSAFLSAFFTLVGCHGAHITAGLLWLGTMMAQIWAKGFQPRIQRRLLCFSLFWHALDIIWVGIFTIVYLLGVAR
jgi:cytochrome o ubiquinol oxidase subunit 3